jgi:hypothetical protein
MFNDSHLREAIVGFVDLILERRLLVLLIKAKQSDSRSLVSLGVISIMKRKFKK